MSDDAGTLPYLPVETTPDSRRFWEELAAGRITIPWCGACDTWVWHPRSMCPRCLSAVDGERTLSGEGTIYSLSIVHRAAEGFEWVGPYAFSYVTLDGGPTVLSNLVGDGRFDASIGERVRFVAPDEPAELGALRFERLTEQLPVSPTG